jgi:hypothetical protein
MWPSRRAGRGGRAGARRNLTYRSRSLSPCSRHEILQAPRHWVKKACQNLIYFNDVDRDGHFAAWEGPELFAAEMRAAFESLR